MKSTDKNIQFELRRLVSKYDNYEALRDRVMNLKCEDPESQDDFIVWKYLKTAGFDHLDENEKKDEKGLPNNPKISVYKNESNESVAGELEPDTSAETEDINFAFFSEFLTFETFDMYMAITPKRMEILDHININEPKSVKDLAFGLGRDYKNVYDDVLGLSKFGLINFIKIGRNKTPITRVDYIQVIPRKY
jgi:predicted transcriptional regulator